jgi:hypothetical protein
MGKDGQIAELKRSIGASIPQTGNLSIVVAATTTAAVVAVGVLTEAQEGRRYATCAK